MRVHLDPAIAELQKLRPAKLRVYVRDSDEPKAVAIPANRKRWERLGTLLEGLDWIRIEALDPRGNISGVVARDEPEPEDMGGVDAGEAERLAPLLALMLKAQDVVLARQMASIKPLVDGQAKMLGVMTEALGAVAGAYRMALAAASTTAPVAGDREGDDGLGKFLQFAMLMAARGGQGPQAAIGAVSAAKAAADARPPTSHGKAPQAPQGANASARGPAG